MGDLIKEDLIALNKSKKCTFLGVGPMSLNCVDVTIDLANKLDIPLFLIASRRQIDSSYFGGGYVNNWDTNNFSKYVSNRDKKKNILMCRDHGGPWQNPKEIKDNLNLKEAMASAKKSYLEDIKSDFKILHIDPSIDIHNALTIDETLNRIFELYEFCWYESQRLNKKITFEIGTEEQSGSTNTQEELEYTLNSIKSFCKISNIPEPTFVVIQCGTRVMETSNVGSFDFPLRVTNEIPAEIQLPRMLKICEKFGIMMKAHNTDYISTESLKWHPKLGIHAVNVAPEFGVIETKAFIDILNKNNLSKIVDEFIKISFETKKWEKWLKPNSSLNYFEKAILSGHYTFCKPEFLELKNKAKSYLATKDINLDNFLKNAIEKSILRYISNFRLVK